MSRVFDGTVGDQLLVDVAPVTAEPFTMACWFRPDGIANHDTLMFLGDKDVSDQFHVLEARGNVAGDPVRARSRDGTSSLASTTAGFIATTWQHACGVWTSTTSRRVLLDGGNAATNTELRTVSDEDRTAIGVSGDSTPNNEMEGRIAEAAIWNVALTDDEVVGLAGGISPLMIRSGSVVGYWPLWGVDSPEPDYGGSNNLAVTGTALADHSPTALMLSPPTGWQGAFTAAAAGISIPVVYHHRQRNF